MHAFARGLIGIPQTCLLICAVLRGQEPRPQIPKVWDDAAIASITLPLAVADATPVQIPSKYYYGIPVRPIFKSYPVYRPDREPAGYLEWLKLQEPQIVFDAAKLRTQDDWIGREIVFDAPLHTAFSAWRVRFYLRLPDWYRSTRLRC
jgi:hypothetical protein